MKSMIRLDAWQALATAALVLMGGVGWCSDFTDSAARTGRVQIRELKSQAVGITPLRVRDVPAMALRLGLAADRDEADTTVVATPFEWSYVTAGESDWWKFKVAGDGIVRLKEQGSGAQTGLADVRLSAARPLAANFIAVGGLVAPTRGDVGSKAWSQSVLGVLLLPGQGALSGQVVAGLVRRGERVEGLGRYVKVVRGELGWELTEALSVSTSLERAQRSGAKSATDLGLDLVFPIGGHESTLSFVRGLSAGSRHTSIGFELEFKF